MIGYYSCIHPNSCFSTSYRVTTTPCLDSCTTHNEAQCNIPEGRAKSIFFKNFYILVMSDDSAGAAPGEDTPSVRACLLLANNPSCLAVMEWMHTVSLIVSPGRMGVTCELQFIDFT